MPHVRANVHVCKKTMHVVCVLIPTAVDGIAGAIVS